jgi:hypothetical protein
MGKDHPNCTPDTSICAQVLFLLHILAPWRNRSTTTSFQCCFLQISDSIKALKCFWVYLSSIYFEDSRTRPVWLCSQGVFSVHGLAISTFYISVHVPLFALSHRSSSVVLSATVTLDLYKCVLRSCPQHIHQQQMANSSLITEILLHSDKTCTRITVNTNKEVCKLQKLK